MSIHVYKHSENKLINVGGGSGDNIPVYTTEEYERIKDTIPEGTKFIISDDYQEKENSNWLKGKVINFLGDSITKGSWYLNGEWQGYMEKPYPVVISEILGCTSNNFGESGTPIEHRESGRGFVDRVNELPAADMNVMFGGVNDLSGGTLGSESSTENTTVYGALKIIAQTFLDKNPRSINVFISPMMSDLTDKVIKYDEIRKAIKYVANLYGFIFIDASVEAPMMNPNVPVINDTWLNGNFVHPNPEYHQVLGRWLAEKLVNLDSSGDIGNKANGSNGCVVLPEIRSNGHTYLKIQWNKLSSSSELALKLICSYGSEVVITGNPYYDKDYNTGSVNAIKVETTDSNHHSVTQNDYITNVYVTSGAIYVKFSGAVAITPVVLGSVDNFGISLSWNDSWEGIETVGGRELIMAKPVSRRDLGELTGDTIKEALEDMSRRVADPYFTQGSRPYLLSATFKDKGLFAVVMYDLISAEFVFDITYSDGKYRMAWKQNTYRYIYKLSEEQI